MKDKILGRTLGGYKIVQPLGMGGMATVYKAFDSQTERHVAIKILPEYYAQYPEFKIRFEREAKSIAQLEHLHILPIFAYGEEDNITYIVMRYLDGGTLTKYIRKQGQLPLDEAHRILTQIAGALDYAHERGVIHRDVKPTNILIDNRNNAILTDFGVAKMLEGDHPDLTATGGIVGTPKYMSPEQCQGHRDLTPASDQYALGIVLFEMLTGDVPFMADTPLAIIQQHLTAPIPSPREERSDLTYAAEKVLLKGLARKPAERYESCAEFASAFGEALEDNETIENEAVRFHDTQPSASVTHVGHTIAGNTYARPAPASSIHKTTPSFTPTPSPPPISHPIPAIQFDTPNRTPLWTWIMGIITVAMLVGGGIYIIIQLLAGTNLPSDRQDDSIEIEEQPYTVGEVIWSAEEIDLEQQAFANGLRFWESIESEAGRFYRTSGMAMEDAVYLDMDDQENYQIEARLHPTSTFAPAQFYPLIEMQLDPAENRAYVLAYAVIDDTPKLYLVRQVDCKEVSTCDILAEVEIKAWQTDQTVNLSFSVYENDLYLRWQQANQPTIVLSADDEFALSAGLIGLVAPRGQVIIYEQIDIFELH